MSPGSQLHFSSRHLGVETQQELDSRNPDELSLNSFSSISLRTKEPAGQMFSSRTPGRKGYGYSFYRLGAAFSPDRGRLGWGEGQKLGWAGNSAPGSSNPAHDIKTKKAHSTCLFLLLITRAFDGGIGFLWASLVAQMVKNLPAMQETRVLSLGREDPWRRK